MAFYKDDYADYDVGDDALTQTDTHVKVMRQKAQQASKNKKKSSNASRTSTSMRVRSFHLSFQDLERQYLSLQRKLEHIPMSFPIRLQTCLFLKSPVFKKEKSGPHDPTQDSIDSQVLRSKQHLTHASVRLTWDVHNFEYKQRFQKLETIAAETEKCLKSVTRLVESVANAGGAGEGAREGARDTSLVTVSQNIGDLLVKLDTFFKEKVLFLMQTLRFFEAECVLSPEAFRTREIFQKKQKRHNTDRPPNTFFVKDVALYASSAGILERIKYVRSKHRRQLPAMPRAERRSLNVIEKNHDEKMVQTGVIPDIFEPCIGSDINIYDFEEVLHYAECVHASLFATETGPSRHEWTERVVWDVSDVVGQNGQGAGKRCIRYERLNVAQYIFKKWNKFVDTMSFDVAQVICEYADIIDCCIYCIKTEGTGVCGKSLFEICDKFYKAGRSIKNAEERVDGVESGVESDEKRQYNAVEAQVLAIENKVALRARCDVESSLLLLNGKKERRVKSGEIKKDHEARFGKVPGLLTYLNRNHHVFDPEHHKFEAKNEREFKKHLKSCIELLHGDQLSCRCLQK